MSEATQTVVAYHEATKHHFHAYARGPGYLDWASQPDPFRRYDGAPLLELALVPPGQDPLHDPALQPDSVEARAFDRESVSQLFQDSLAVSAWKQAGGEAWALRINPSSGNLHPTEAHLLCGSIEGLNPSPMACHYAPREHALERRVEFSPALWDELTADLPGECLLIGLTSIHWREAWKYGERAFRYCQHDIGHAIASLSVAAVGLGWRVCLLDGIGTGEIADLLGVGESTGEEAEHPHCLLAILRDGVTSTTCTLPPDPVEKFHSLAWTGRPNRLSPEHVDWPIIDQVARATLKPRTDHCTWASRHGAAGSPMVSPSRRIIHQRRSALAMDPRSWMDRDVFYRILARTLPLPGSFLLDALPWASKVHLLLFVHRVRGIDPGLYLLVRDPGQSETLRSALKGKFSWSQPAECPRGLELYLLAEGDARAASRAVSCHQEIASDGCFSLGMVTDFSGTIERHGAWFYPRLFWECGAVGQILYLEAESAGFRGTGIGCFFDDAVHDMIGLDSPRYQSLYHFTIGSPVEDPRITTLPAYPRSR